MSDIAVALRQAVFGKALEMPPSDWPEDSSDLFELGLDSMTILRILVAVEEELGIKLSERDLEPERVQSLDAIRSWIESERTN